MTEKEVAILGMGIGAHKAPIHVERWGINNAYIFGKIDRLFLMHKPDVLNKTFESTDKDRDRTIQECVKEGTKLYSLIDKIEVAGKQCIEFPVYEISKSIGCHDYSCSASYLIALAIHEGYTRIRLYGFEVWNNKNEYAFERPSIERWIARAEAKGIVVEVPFSLVYQQREKNILYGYQD